MAVGLVVVAACSSDPKIAADPESAVVPETATSSILDTTTSSTTPSDPEPVTAAPSEAAATPTTDETARPADPAGASDPVATPAPGGAATAPMTIPATPTTDDEVVGDGPVLADALPDDPDQAVLAPAFFVFDAAITQPCGGDFGTVTVRWEVIGTEAVYVAVNDVDEPFLRDQPPAGLAEVPLDCERGNIYFVVAENPEGRSFRSIAIAPSGQSSVGG